MQYFIRYGERGSLTAGVDVGATSTLGFAQGDNWRVFSVSGSVSVGAGVSTPIAIGVTGGKGNVKFQNRNDVGKYKSTWQTISSYYKLFTFFNWFL